MGVLEILTIILGFILRVGVPLGITFLFVWLLKRLDTSWKVEAEKEHRRLLGEGAQAHCWEYYGCAPHRRQKCPAFNNQENPCWENFKVGRHLQESCRLCAFRQKTLALMAAAD